MSQKLVSHSPDLKKLRDEGYEIEVRKGHLLVHQIPYVTARKDVAFGVLVTSLGDLAGDRTAKPQDHMMYFIGEHPCDKNGNLLKGIQHGSGKQTLAEGIEVDHSFSNKPPDGYPDYHAKVTTYCRIISAEAQAINPNVRAQTFRVIETSDDPDLVFWYLDANSSKAEIDVISDKVKGLRVAIIGAGGTGSYVLDFVAKTHVKEIHLFDQDTLLTHNAFRAPGAAPLETLREQPKKVAYLHGLYSKMHKYVIPHEYHLSEPRLGELAEMGFVFICIDEGDAKAMIVKYLADAGIPFIDVGIGIHAIDGALTGSARVTMVTREKKDHIDRRISFAEGGHNGEYDKNIQIAEINALNAAMAVIKWKKLFGFYHDLEHEHHATYEININKIFNDEAVA